MARSTRQYRDGAGGFTLLEVLLVLTLLGFLAAMLYPALGLMNHRERIRITEERMGEIRRAIVGDPDRYDEAGRRIIGGYVGDIGDWPELWEARAQIKPGFTGFGWDDPENISAGLGQGPDYAMNPAFVVYRPSGHFVKGSWRWHQPYRMLTNDTVDNDDHIGGLATENEGQPRGLWSRFPEELPEDLGSGASLYEAPGRDLGERWQGPYLTPPTDRRPDDAGHYAEDDAAYQELVPRWTSPGAWEDGDYLDPDGGEPYDEKEAFRLLQTADRLADGWERALRFFITEDLDQPSESFFWILSEGPDGRAVYPTKGSYTGGTWVVNADDTMAREYDPSDPVEAAKGGYDPDHEYNQDNIIMKIHSSEWRAILAAREERRRQATAASLAAIRRALLGESSAAEGGYNAGFTGTLGRWPELFRWEDNGTPADPGDDFWDDENDDPAAYTKGQPRGLWTDRPNSADPADNLLPPTSGSWGFGWVGPYLPAPMGSGGEELLSDAWGREILFFRTDGGGDDCLLLLSRGSDGLVDFGDPADPVEALTLAGYDPAAAGNADNVALPLCAAQWRPAQLTLQLTVLNAIPSSPPPHPVTKAALVRGWDYSGGLPGTAVLELVRVTDLGETLTDEDGDSGVDDWRLASPFQYDGATLPPALAGTRQLLVWQESDGNDALDSGEDHLLLPFTLHVHKDLDNPAMRNLTVDTATFTPAP